MSFNYFTAADFWKWYGDLRLSFRTSHKTARFLPHIGTYITRYMGHSSEFLDYTEYQMGDDPRLLSKRLFARNRRWFTKRMHHRSPIRATVVIDGTRSMFYPQELAIEARSHQKWVQQCRVACFFVRELLASGDRCVIIVRGEKADRWINVSQIRDFYFLLDALEKWQPDGVVNHEIRGQRQHHLTAALLLVCSDFIFEEDLKVLKEFVSLNRDRRLCVAEFRHPDEVEGQVPTPIMLHDVEDRGVVRCLSLRDSQAYVEAQDTQHQKLFSLLRSLSTPFVFVEHKNPEHLLKTLLQLMRWGEM